jgi:phosphatidylserine synthase
MISAILFLAAGVLSLRNFGEQLDKGSLVGMSVNAGLATIAFTCFLVKVLG